MAFMVFAALFLFAIALFLSTAIIMLVRPSKFLDDQSDWRRNTVESRISVRSVGMVSCLFTLTVGSSLVTHTHFGRFFRDYLVIALWTSFFLTPIANFLLWRLSAQKFARQALIVGINEDPVYERKLSALYIGLLFLTLMVVSLCAVLR
jgi:cellobiose-specific phosphotransferase system component IIC